MDRVLSISIGHDSICGYFHDGKESIAVELDGSPIVPNAISFTQAGIVIGTSALKAASKYPSSTFTNVLSLLSKSETEVKWLLESKNWNICKSDNDIAFVINVGEFANILTAKNLETLVLKHFKKLAQRSLQQRFVKIVLVLPLRLDTNQMNDLKSAALEVVGGPEFVRVIPLHEAVFVNYCLNYRSENISSVCVRELSVDYLCESVLSFQDLSNKYQVTIKEPTRCPNLASKKLDVAPFDMTMACMFGVSKEECKNARMALNKGAQSYKLTSGQEISRAIIFEKLYDINKNCLAQCPYQKDTIRLCGFIKSEAGGQIFELASHGKSAVFDEYQFPAIGGALYIYYESWFNFKGDLESPELLEADKSNKINTNDAKDTSKDETSNKSVNGDKASGDFDDKSEQSQRSESSVQDHSNDKNQAPPVEALEKCDRNVQTENDMENNDSSKNMEDCDKVNDDDKKIGVDKNKSSVDSSNKDDQTDSSAKVVSGYQVEENTEDVTGTSRSSVKNIFIFPHFQKNLARKTTTVTNKNSGNNLINILCCNCGIHRRKTPKEEDNGEPGRKIVPVNCPTNRPN